MKIRRPQNRIVHVAFAPQSGRLDLAAGPVHPSHLLDLKRADTSACAKEVVKAAQTLGADRSITEQDEGRKPTAVGVNLRAEQGLSDKLAQALGDCPSAAKAAGVSANELTTDLAASKETVIIGQQAWHIARGANEARLVFGHAIAAVVDAARDGLVTLINQGGAPDAVTSARADLALIETPLTNEAQAQVERGQDTRDANAALSGEVSKAKEAARFAAIVSALRAGEVAQVSSEDILWAQRFAEAQPVEAAPVAPSNRRQKGR